MSIKTRLAQLKRAADESTPKKPLLILEQDSNDDDLYHCELGDYWRAELGELAEQYQLIQIDYAKDWRAVVG